jgi:hypothetical protein
LRRETKVSGIKEIVGEKRKNGKLEVQDNEGVGSKYAKSKFRQALLKMQN